MRFLSYLTTLIFAVFLAACGGGGGSSGTSSGATATALFTTAPAALNLVPGETGTYQISGGTPPYTASSGNLSLVTAVAAGSSLTFTGVASGGPVSVVISDGKGANIAVAVTVAAPTPLATTAPSALTVASGQTSTFTISGGVPPYIVTSSNAAVVRGSVTGNTLTISGLSTGAASLVINDTKGTAPITVAVTVPAAGPILTTAPSALTVAAGQASSFTISGGVAPYTVTSSNVAIASGSVNGNTLTINGLSAGSASIVINDAKGTAPITVAVTVPAPNALQTTAPPAVTVAMGQASSFTISGGVAPYVVTTSNSAVATGAVVNGNTLTLMGVSAGSASIFINDAKGTAPIVISVTVPALNALQTTAPPAITLASGQSGSFTVSGGAPPYVVTSSNSSVTTASVVGNSLTISGVAVGAGTIVLNDSKGTTPITIAVTVPAPSPLQTTAPAAITVATGESSNFTISGGVQPYVVSTSNASVATATVNGSLLTINGRNNGAAVILVNDAKGTTPVSIAVTVGATVALSTNAPSALTMGQGVSYSFSIVGGTAPYGAVSSNPAVVTASATGNVLSLSALTSGGPVSVIINDSQGAKVTVNVTVPASGALFTSAPPAVTIAVGQVNSYFISGGVAPYVATSSNQAVAIASASGGSLSITALASGSASIVLSDAKGTQVTVAVTVPAADALYTTAPAAITIAPGQVSSYLISGGTAPYTATSNNPAVATALAGGRTLAITAVSAGAATIVISDAKGASISVSVAVGTGGNFFVNAPAALAMGAGTPASFAISGGSLPYVATSTDPRIATATVSGSTLTITPLKSGVVTIQVFDASGKSISITVTVDGNTGATAVAAIEILPSSNSLNSAAGSTVTFLVTVMDASRNTVPGQTVTFTATSGSLVVNPTPAVTGASGSLATVSLSPGADPFLRSITVTARVGSVSNSVTIPVVGTTVSISGPGSTLMGVSGLAYTLKATDSGGKPISGAVLTPSSALGNPFTPSTVTTDVAGSASVSYTSTVAGTDTLTVSGLNASSKTTVVVSNQDFAFTTPAAGANLVVSTPNPVTVRYRLNGVGVAGQTVSFSSTRGTVTPATVVTDVNGDATVSILSSTAGPATLSAQLGSARTTLAVNFVATTPATVFLQANPSAVFPNTIGSSLNQSSLSATVRDAVGNPVAGQVINFTAISDPSNGTITPGSATTDSSGIATAQFVPGALSTPANGVVLQATVQGTAISSTASLTVNGAALFISIGMSNTLEVVDNNTYAKSFSVYVTDVNGAPVANRAVTLSVYPTFYGKGRLTYDAAIPQWVYSATSPTVCANEDVNRNGILDSGEDINSDGLLTPGLPVVLVPAALTTDANGYSTFKLNYGKNFAFWLGVQITAKASVGGTESSKVINYPLSMLAADATSPSSPANQTSPFGTATVCTDKN